MPLPSNSLLQLQQDQLARQAALLDQLRREVQRLTEALAESRAARAKELPASTLTRLVKGAYENGSLSGGEAAEILSEGVSAFLGRRWREARHAATIADLRAKLAGQPAPQKTQRRR